MCGLDSSKKSLLRSPKNRTQEAHILAITYRAAGHSNCRLS